MYKKILVPLDGSRLAEAVLPHAQALAKSEGAEIIILRVPALPAAELFTSARAMASIINKELEEEAKTYVKDKVAYLKDEHIKAQGITKDGPPPDIILSVAEEAHADIIAISTHGQTGGKRWSMGSVADKVVRNAHVPVMLIPSI